MRCADGRAKKIGGSALIDGSCVIEEQDGNGNNKIVGLVDGFVVGCFSRDGCC